MSVKYGLLGILARKPQHGYELKRSFEQITGGFWELNYGQIYQTLDRLEQDGFVTFSIEQEDNVPDKKVYEITQSGRSALSDWLDQPDPKPRPLRDELFIRLAVMSPYDVEPILDLLGAHYDLYMKKMAQLTRAKQQLKSRPEAPKTEAELLVEDLLIDVGLFHAEADIRWLEHCEAKLKAFAAKAKN